MKIYTIPGTYGSSKTPCNVLCAEKRDGSTWYVVEGSSNVNLSSEPLAPGVDVEEVQDIDTFTWPAGVHDENELEQAIDA
jgi:hypothetical protein